MAFQRFFIKAWATGFGLGYIPGAPGTYGTLLGMPLFLLLSGLTWWSYLLTLVGFIFFSIWVSGFAGMFFGEHDSQKIVIDEVAGYLVTMMLIPPYWLYLVIGFVIFRVLDVIKPWPACYFDRRMENGFGVVLDDVAAGLYACGLLHLFVYLHQNYML